jgi:GNAT superfamily N-acetyltransferase
MSCHIRTATPNDAQVIHELVFELATYERCPEQVEATPESLRVTLFPEDGRAPIAHCILAERAGEVVGFALYFFNYSTWLARPGLYLEDLYVRPAHRALGVGKALLLHLARHAHERGCGRMEWAVLDWNQPAIDFYESLGAQRLTDWTVCRLDRAALARHAAFPRSEAGGN